jgi:hypothetical protein
VELIVEDVGGERENPNFSIERNHVEGRCKAAATPSGRDILEMQAQIGTTKRVLKTAVPKDKRDPAILEKKLNHGRGHWSFSRLPLRKRIIGMSMGIPVRGIIVSNAMLFVWPDRRR